MSVCVQESDVCVCVCERVMRVCVRESDACVCARE